MKFDWMNEIRLTPPPRLWNYFIKFRYFLNDGFPYVCNLWKDVKYVAQVIFIQLRCEQWLDLTQNIKRLREARKHGGRQNQQQWKLVKKRWKWDLKERLSQCGCSERAEKPCWQLGWPQIKFPYYHCSRKKIVGHKCHDFDISDVLFSYWTLKQKNTTLSYYNIYCIVKSR